MIKTQILKRERKLTKITKILRQFFQVFYNQNIDKCLFLFPYMNYKLAGLKVGS